MARFGGIVAAEPDPASVGGHDVVIVALGDGPGIDFLQVCGPVGGDLVQAAAFVDDQPFAVRRPVGRLDHIGELLHDLVRACPDIEDFQVTVCVPGVLGGGSCDYAEEEKEGESYAHVALELGFMVSFWARPGWPARCFVPREQTVIYPICVNIKSVFYICKRKKGIFVWWNHL